MGKADELILGAAWSAGYQPWTGQRIELDHDPNAYAEQEEDYRSPGTIVLRTLPRPYSEMMGEGGATQGRCVALVDLETISLYPETGAIIELAVKLLGVADEGKLLGPSRPSRGWKIRAIRLIRR